MPAPYVSVISSARWRFVLVLCTRSLSGDRESYKKRCNEVERHILVGHAHSAQEGFQAGRAVLGAIDCGVDRSGESPYMI